MMVSFVLSFFPRDVLGGILDLIESVSGGLLPILGKLYSMVQFEMHLGFNNFPVISKFDAELVNSYSSHAGDLDKYGYLSNQWQVAPKRNV